MSTNADALIESLLKSEEPSIQWKTRVHILGESIESPPIKKLQKRIKTSERVKKLLCRFDEKEGIRSRRNAYDKWQGAHWIMATLADIGFPAREKKLFKVRDDILNLWLSERFYNGAEVKRKADAYKFKNAIPLIGGRYRTCASQQGYALFYLLKLGLFNDKAEGLVERLLHWQWPDGGWNCDKEPSAATSTFIHTAISLRGLNEYLKLKPNAKVKKSVKRAKEFLLDRELYLRKTNQKVVKEEFTLLHYPLYWHYDILGSLKIMGELDSLKDKRVSKALDLLQSYELKSGGWPAHKKYYKPSQSLNLGNDYCDWGPTGKTKMNEWVTVDALTVLVKSGRINI